MATSARSKFVRWDEEFKAFYEQLKAAAGLDLVALSPEIIEKIGNTLRREQLTSDNTRYITGATGATVATTLSAFLIRSSWVFFGTYTSHIVAFLERPYYSTIAVVGLSFAVFTITYAVVLPLMTSVPLYGQFLRWSTRTSIRIDLKSRQYLFYLLISLYLVFPVIVAAIASVYPRARPSMPIALLLWLAPALILLATIIAVFVTAPFLRPLHDQPESTQHVALRLLRIIHELEQIDTISSLTRGDKHRLLNQIGACARRIRELYPEGVDPADDWARAQLGIAGTNFLALSSWLYFPQQGTLESLRRTVGAYANVFLTGNLHELPRSGISELPGLSHSTRETTVWAKVPLYFGVLAYLGIPPAILIIVTVIRQIAVPALAQGPLILLYTIWVLCGVVFFAEKFSPDARALFADVFKAIVGRK